MMDLPDKQIHEVIPELLRISRDAGRAILDVYNSDFAVEHKEDKSPLTLADRRSHEVILQGLSSLQGFDIPILSEEGKNTPYEERLHWDLFWLVDPLDGTKEFVRRNGEFTVNIALIQRGRPLFGVIYIPVKDVYYFGAEGLGSYRIDSGDIQSFRTFDDIIRNAVKLPLVPLPLSTNARITVIGSRSHMSPETERFITKLRAEYGEVEFISAGSSLKFCLIAEGNADVYPRFGPTMEWDTAAGQAIVEQTGGTVVRADTGEPLSYNKESLLNPSFVAEGRSR